MEKRLSDLPNIGKKLELLLEDAGVETPADLERLGAVEVCLRLKLAGEACYSKLYALEGAIRGIRWHDIPAEERKELKKAYDGEK